MVSKFLLLSESPEQYAGMTKDLLLFRFDKTNFIRLDQLIKKDAINFPGIDKHDDFTEEDGTS